MANVIPRNELLELSGYLNRISSRLEKLQNVSTELSSQVGKQASLIASKRGELKHELDNIKDDVTNLKLEARSIQKDILKIINQLKGSVKAEDLERFKKRMDLWSPESLVTRREAERVLKEL